MKEKTGWGENANGGKEVVGRIVHGARDPAAEHGVRAPAGEGCGGQPGALQPDARDDERRDDHESAVYEGQLLDLVELHKPVDGAEAGHERGVVGAEGPALHAHVADEDHDESVHAEGVAQAGKERVDERAGGEHRGHAPAQREHDDADGDYQQDLVGSDGAEHRGQNGGEPVGDAVGAHERGERGDGGDKGDDGPGYARAEVRGLEDAEAAHEDEADDGPDGHGDARQIRGEPAGDHDDEDDDEDEDEEDNEEYENEDEESEEDTEEDFFDEQEE